MTCPRCPHAKSVRGSDGLRHCYDCGTVFADVGDVKATLNRGCGPLAFGLVLLAVTVFACSPEPEMREPAPVCSLATPLVIDTTPPVEAEMARDPCPFMSHQPCSADECPGNPDGEVVSWRRVR